MKPTTISDFSRTLLRTKWMSDINEKSFGKDRGSTLFVEINQENEKMVLMCNKCFSLLPVKISRYHRSVLSADYQSCGEFDISPKVYYNGTCPFCNEKRFFTPLCYDFANIMGILFCRGYQCELKHYDIKDQYILTIQPSSTFNKFTWHDNWEYYLEKLPITLSYDLYHLKVNNLKVNIYLDKCNYDEGIYELGKWVSALPDLAYYGGGPYPYWA